MAPPVRTLMLTFRATEAEKEMLRTIADSEGQRLATWLRSVVLHYAKKASKRSQQQITLRTPRHLSRPPAA